MTLDGINETQFRLSDEHLRIELVNPEEVEENALIKVMVDFFCGRGHKESPIGEDVFHLEANYHLTSHCEVRQVCNFIRYTRRKILEDWLNAWRLANFFEAVASFFCLWGFALAGISSHFQLLRHGAGVRGLDHDAVLYLANGFALRQLPELVEVDDKFTKCFIGDHQCE